MKDFFTVGQRKFILSMVVVLMAGVLCFIGKVDGGQFTNIIITTVLAFCGANAGVHLAEAWGKRAQQGGG